jgi:hypothetical protein
VPLAKEEVVLQGIINRIIEIGRCWGMELNVEKFKVMRISRQPSPLQIMINKRQLQNVGYFNCFGSMITNDARCTREIKSRIAVTKAAFNRRKEETSELLHLVHSIVWC